MSYETYTTEALVCGSFEQNTADKSFLLFTREAGMLFASARSVREEVSKQRCALQDFSKVRVSLIKGKQGWRVGSVEIIKNDFTMASDRAVRASVLLIYRLLRRFIRGEEAFPDLYDFTVLALTEVQKSQPKRRMLDLFIQMRLLSMLGYVDETKIPDQLKKRTLSDISVWQEPESSQLMEQIVTTATENSHL